MSHLEKKRYAAGKGGDESADGTIWAEPPAKPNNTASYFFLAAFSAAFVTWNEKIKIKIWSSDKKKINKDKLPCQKLNPSA